MAYVRNNIALAREFNRDRSEAICSEFEYKVSYDFKCLVFLAPFDGNVSLDQILHEVYNTEGYQAHKIAYHGEMPSHIHIRYEDEAKAVGAIRRFTHPSVMEGGRVAAKQVSDLLISIYETETLNKRFPAWTLTLVDIEGRVEHTNPLSKDVVRLLLLKFGEPRIFTYNTGQNASNHVQALFSSMAEALGASIAHGKWMKMEEPESPRFRYRVRLIGSDKEREVMARFSSSESDGIFEMDYFVGNDLHDYHAPSLPIVPPPNEQYLPVAPFPQFRPRRTFSKSRDGEFTSNKNPNFRPHRPFNPNGRRYQNQIPVVANQEIVPPLENLPN